MQSGRDQEDTHRPPNRPFRRRIANLPIEDLDERPTVWQLYNHRATLVDRELIKDWTESLNTLLIFAALYSAVLTAFIIESMSLLEEDPTQSTFDVLLVISMQLANQSTAPYHKPEFIVPAFAVRVNGYFFFSISCSLVAALGAVLALQWVGSYDAGLNASSPEDRALQRHLRYFGVLDWNMPEIIAALPLLIFLALGLFFAGLTDWLWNIHKGLAGIVLAAIGTSTVFYITTTFISVFSPGAPFRTPLSRSFPLVFAHFLAILKSGWHALKTITLAKTKRAITRKLARLWKILQKHKRNNTKTTVISVKRLSRLIEEKSFEEREEQMIRDRPLHHLSSLLWILSSIEISEHSRDYFIQLLESILTLPAHQISIEKLSAPWIKIYSFLCRPYQSKRKFKDYSEAELPDATFLLRSLSAIGTWECDDATLSFLRSFNDASIKEISLNARIATWKHTTRKTEEWCSIFQETIEDACRNMELLTPEFVQHLLVNIEVEQHRTPRQVYLYVVNMLADMCGASQKIDESINFTDQIKTVSPKTLDMVVRVMTKALGRSRIEDDTPVENFVFETEDHLREDSTLCQDVIHWYRAIYRQLLRRLARPASNQEIGPILKDLSRVVKSSVWNHVRFTSEQRTPTLLSAITTLFSKYLEKGKETYEGERHTCQLGIQLISFALPNPYSFDPSHRREQEYAEWFTRNLLGLEAMISNKDLPSNSGLPTANALITQHLLKITLPFYREIRTTLNGEQKSRLAALKAPYLRLVASMCGADEKVIMLPPNTAVIDASWEDLLKLWWSDFGRSPRVDRSSLVELLREMLINGSPPVSTFASEIIIDDKIDVTSSECSSLFIYPGLSIVLWRQEQIRPSQFTDLLTGLNSFDWFTREFLLSRGLSWIEQALRKQYFDPIFAIEFIMSIVDQAEGQERIMDCIQSLKVMANLPAATKDAPVLHETSSRLYAIFQKQALERVEAQMKKNKNVEIETDSRVNEDKTTHSVAEPLPMAENTPIETPREAEDIDKTLPMMSWTEDIRLEMPENPPPKKVDITTQVRREPLEADVVVAASSRQKFTRWKIGPIPDHSSEGPFDPDLPVPPLEEVESFVITDYRLVRSAQNTSADRSDQWRYLVHSAPDEEWNTWRSLVEEVCVRLSETYIRSIFHRRRNVEERTKPSTKSTKRTLPTNRIRKNGDASASNAWHKVKSRVPQDIFPAEVEDPLDPLEPRVTIPEDNNGEPVVSSIVGSVLDTLNSPRRNRLEKLRTIARHIINSPSAPLNPGIILNMEANSSSTTRSENILPESIPSDGVREALQHRSATPELLPVLLRRSTTPELSESGQINPRNADSPPLAGQETPNRYEWQPDPNYVSDTSEK